MPPHDVMRSLANLKLTGLGNLFIAAAAGIRAAWWGIRPSLAETPPSLARAITR